MNYNSSYQFVDGELLNTEFMCVRGKDWQPAPVVPTCVPICWKIIFVYHLIVFHHLCDLYRQIQIYFSDSRFKNYINHGSMRQFLAFRLYIFVHIKESKINKLPLNKIKLFIAFLYIHITTKCISQ